MQVSSKKQGHDEERNNIIAKHVLNHSLQNIRLEPTLRASTPTPIVGFRELTS
jgi:hypothetical protein